MAVKIENTFHVVQPIEMAWALLSDPRRVVTCVPGAQITEVIDDRNFKGTISLKVGPSVTDYKGQVHIERLEPEHYEIEMVCKGQDVRGKGSASMVMIGKLLTLSDGTTEVTAVSEVNVIGLLAQLGSRMIQDVSGVIFKDFVKRFQQQLENANGEAIDPNAKAEPVQAVRVVGSAIGQAVRRTFHRKPEEAPEET
jgi:carbon monoxide dehydrogenase subunit G